MAWQTIAGETVLLDVDGRQLYGVSEVAARVWQLCDGVRTVADIAALVAEEYDTDARTALSDVRAFVGELVAAGALLTDRTG